jgi:16S rRNA (guanine527-N7)-methyltransferase
MSLHPQLHAVLQAGLEQLNCPLESSQQQQLLDFVALLDKWNRVYNLTAVRTPAGMLGQHILDSLSILPYLHGDCILDVGTGAGLPGIPLAIAQPGRSFLLLDSNSKKTRFMKQAVVELKLKNVVVVQARIEAFTSDQAFTSIVSRAFASMADFIYGCAHLCQPQTVLLAMKGKHPADEILTMPSTWQISAEHELQLPGVEGERRLLEIIQKK